MRCRPSLFRDLLVNGVIAGVGSVLVFLPQIIILFFFILVLEDSGYLPRAAFLLDRLMGSVGLSGRAFIPLLSSFACAIPGIMATRTIQSPRDRLSTIMIAPLMTCSARLPVYALIIGAFVPQRTVWGGLKLQGLVLFALYVAGIAGAMGVAFVLKRRGAGSRLHSLMLELPAYHWPNLRNLAIGLWQRIEIFLSRVGTIILSLMVILWALSSFPAPPPGATGPAIQYSIAGHIGSWLAVLFGPIGFNWQISIALVPGLAAREVAVGALGTVYALSAAGADVSHALTPLIAQSWNLPTALSLLAWYVFAPQCVSTLATVKRETNSWRYPLIMAAYLFGLAYLASWVTYRLALHLQPEGRNGAVRTLLDDSLVGIALLASALYAIYSLGPRTLRGRMLAGMAAALRGLSVFPAFRVGAKAAGGVGRPEGRVRRMRRLRTGAAAGGAPTFNPRAARRTGAPRRLRSPESPRDVRLCVQQFGQPGRRDRHGHERGDGRGAGQRPNAAPAQGGQRPRLRRETFDADGELEDAAIAAEIAEVRTARGSRESARRAGRGRARRDRRSRWRPASRAARGNTP